MNNTRRKWLRNRLDASAEPLWAAIQQYEEGVTRNVCMGIVDGAKFAADSAVSGVAALDKLWGVRGDADKATKLLKEFSFEMLSMWLWKRSSLASVEGGSRDESLEWLLTAFDDRTDDAVDRFTRRDIQRQYELTNEPTKGGSHVIGAMLLLSDAAVALGGNPMIHPVPTDGYPFEHIMQFLTKGEPERDDTQVGDLFLVSTAALDGAIAMYRGLGMTA